MTSFIPCKGSHLNVNTPLGELVLYARNGKLVGLARAHEKKKECFQVLEDEKLLQKAANQLAGYFCGKRKKFDIPLETHEATKYQRQVWREMQQIPFGETLSYGELAERVSLSTSPRAVARACAANPLLIFVPCHRILRRGGELGGFSAGLDAKRKLLNLEGSSYRVVD